MALRDLSLTRFEPLDEDGGITVLSILLFIVMLAVAGLAIDVSYALQQRAQLQIAADSAGHAALYWRWRESTGEIVDPAAEAQAVAMANMGGGALGDILATSEVEFGDWDNIARTFTPDPTEFTAVRVTTRRNQTNANAVKSMLMNFVGVDAFDMSAVSVWDLEDGFCPPRDDDGDGKADDGKERGEGFFSVDRLDIQSNSSYYDGFCAHSDTHTEFQNNNTFEEGVTVSMPDEGDLQVPDFAEIDIKNKGLTEALASVDYNLESFFNEFPDIVDNFFDLNYYVSDGYNAQPSYVDNSSLETIALKGGDKLTSSLLTPNKVHKVTCSGGASGGTISITEPVIDVVIITDCAVSFGSGGILENSTLVTRNTSATSVKGASGFRMGATNYCTDGHNGASILTLGGFSASSGMDAYGANLIAAGDVALTANTDGLGGINFVSGGMMDVTSNSDHGFCNYGPPDIFLIPVFRMVM